MRERMSRMWPFSWLASSPEASSRSLYLANTTASLQHNPLYRIFIDPSVRTLLSTNTFLSDNTALHSWNYLLLLWSYAAGAIAFGLTSILTLPDPQTLAKIDEKEQQLAEQQLKEGQESFDEEISPPTGEDNQDVPMISMTQNDVIMRSKIYQPQNKPKIYYKKYTPIPNYKPVPTRQTRNVGVIERQSSHAPDYEESASDYSDTTPVNEDIAHEEKEEEYVYPGPNKYNNYPPDPTDEKYVYPGPNKFNNYPPDMNNEKDTWALEIYTKFMKFYNNQREKLNRKFPKIEPFSVESSKGKNSTQMKPHRYRPRPHMRPHLTRYHGHHLRRPIFYQPNGHPVRYMRQPPHFVSQSTVLHKNPSEALPMHTHYSEEKPLSYEAGNWKAITQSPPPSMIYKHESQQPSPDAPRTNMHSGYKTKTKQSDAPSDLTGFQRVPNAHSLYKESSNGNAAQYVTSKPMEEVRSGTQSIRPQSLLQQMFNFMNTYRSTNEKSKQTSKEDIPNGFQEPEKHSLYKEFVHQTPDKPKSNLKSEEDVPNRFQKTENYHSFRVSHEKTTIAPGDLKSTLLKSDGDIPIGFKEPEKHSLYQTTEKSPYPIPITTGEESPQFIVRFEEQNNPTLKSDGDIPMGIKKPEKHSLYQITEKSPYPIPTTTGEESPQFIVRFEEQNNPTSRKDSVQYSLLPGYTTEKAKVTSSKIKKPFNELYQKLFDHSSKHQVNVQAESSTKQREEFNSKLDIEPAKLFSMTQETVDPIQPVETSSGAKQSYQILQPVYSPEKGEEVGRYDQEAAPAVPKKRNEVKFVETEVVHSVGEKQTPKSRMPIIKLPENAQLTESAEELYNDWMNLFHAQGE